MLSLSSSKCIAALVMLLQLSNALHFYVKTGETKCFYEELPENTLVVGKIDAYEKQDHSNEYFKNPNLKVQITVEVCTQTYYSCVWRILILTFLSFFVIRNRKHSTTTTK